MIKQFSEEELDYIWAHWSTLTAKEMGHRLNIHKGRLRKVYGLLGLPRPSQKNKIDYVQPPQRPVVIQVQQVRRYRPHVITKGLDEYDQRWQSYWSMSREQRLRSNALEGCGV